MTLRIIVQIYFGTYTYNILSYAVYAEADTYIQRQLVSQKKDEKKKSVYICIHVA